MSISSTLESESESQIGVDSAGPAPAKRWSRRRRIGLGAVAVAVIASGSIGIWTATHGAASASPITVTTQQVAVTTGTMKQTVSTSGTIQPGAEADLNFAVSGKVTAINVTVGQAVTSGQTLATVASTALADSVQAAQMTLAAGSARLSSDQAANASTSQILSDEASVTSAQSQLTVAQTNLANANLTSTVSGTVASVALSVGQEVSSGSGSTGSGSGPSGSGGAGTANTAASSSSSSSSSTQIVVVSTGSFSVATTVDDTQVGTVKVGDQAVITPSGSATNVYGTVSSVGLIASSSTSSVAKFPVVISVTGAPSGLYAGSSATVSIVVQQLNNIVQVPTAAISYSGGVATVTKVVAGKQVSQTVTTGVSASGQTQITSGLQAGDLVIERVVKFNGTTGGGRNLLGGTGTTGGTRPAGGFGGGGFPGGGAGGGAQGGGN